MIGREYEGPCKDVLRTPSMNVPAQSSKDRDWGFDWAYRTLPKDMFTRTEWNTLTHACLYPENRCIRNQRRRIKLHFEQLNCIFNLITALSA